MNQSTFWKLFGSIGIAGFAMLFLIFDGGVSEDTEPVYAFDPAWPYRIELSIAPGISGGELVDFVLPLDMSLLPADFFTHVASDGADIRITQSDGSTELPREIVTIDSRAGTGELYFRATVSDRNTSTYYIYYGNAAASEPAASAANGSEAVWTGYSVVHHFETIDKGVFIDSSGNGNTASISDPAFVRTTSTASTIVGSNGVYISKAENYINLPKQPINTIFPDLFYVSFFAQVPSKTGSPSFGFLGNSSKAAALNRMFLSGTNFFTSDGTTVSKPVTFSTIDSNPNSIAINNGGARNGFDLYQNGSSIVTGQNLPNPSTSSLHVFAIGVTGFTDAPEGYVGYLDEFRVRTSSVSSAWASFEHFSRIKQNTVWTVGTQEFVGGSGAITWDGDAGDGNWCSRTNWSGDVVPTDSDDVVIDIGETVDTSPCNSSAVEFASLTLGETASNKLYLYASKVGTAGDVTIAGNGLLYQFETSTITFTGDLIIENGGMLLSQTNDTLHEHSVNITATNIDIQSGGEVNVDGLGYGGGKGPGTSPTALNVAGGGAGHGGDGASGEVFSTNKNLGGTATCDITNPTSIGSGGGGRNGTLAGSGSDGGGHIRLVALGTLTINGNISADGEAGNGASGGFADGGGAGGSIYLETDVLSGTTGDITFTGGVGHVDSQRGGGGGGGCMLLVYSTDTRSSGILDASAVSMSGGTDISGSQAGGAGVYLVKTPSTSGTLYVDGSAEGVRSTQIVDTLTVDTVVTTNGGIYSIGSGKTLVVRSTNGFAGGDGTGSVRIDDGGTFSPPLTMTLSSTTLEFHSTATWTSVTATIVTISNAGILDVRDYVTSTPALTFNTIVVNDEGVITHGANTSTLQHIVNLAATTMTVNAGGAIDVDAKGYTGDNGPGAGEGEDCGGGGGSHGGDGGTSELFSSCQSAGGTAYAVSSNPNSIQLGSGGGGKNGVISGTGSQGGGMIKLDISGTFTIEGTITADGAVGNGSSGGFDDGGGAGGGLYIQVGTLAGTPQGITLTGGAGFESVVHGGGGGGGAVYVLYNTTSLVVDDFAVTAGTSTEGGPGENGFVVLTQPNTLPIATIGVATQLNASYVAVTSSITEDDNDVTSLAVEYSTDGLIWSDATIGAVTLSEGSISTTTGQINGIDTDLDGRVIVNFRWNVATDISGIDDASVYLRITPNDGVGDGVSVSTTAFAVDAQAPIITNNGSLTITTDGGRPGVAGIGDGITLSGVTTTIDDSHVITIDYGIVGGSDDTLLGAEDYIGTGLIDGFTTFTIRVTDDIGNTTVTSSDALSIDNQAPVISNNGTISIIVDNGTGGIAGIGDQIQLTGVSTTIDDSDEVTMDLSSIGASATTIMGGDTRIVAGSTDDTVVFTLTVTDNAGNTATTTTDGISIDNIAPIAASGGTVTISDDVDGNGIAAVGDRITFTAGSLNTPDTVTWAIDVTTLTGQATLAAGATSTAITTGTLDSAVQTFVVTIIDDAGNTATTTSGAVDVDNQIPVLADNGRLSISTNTGIKSVAGIGDGLTLSGVTTAIADDDVVTIDYGIVGGNDETLMGTEGFVGTGSIDTSVSFVINITDNAGNSITSTSDTVRVDNQAPTILRNGTFIISRDANANGIAEVNDGVTLSGVTLNTDDDDTIVIDLTDLTGAKSLAIDTEDLVIGGAVSSSVFSATITVTDNAGNVVATTSDAIAVNNVTLKSKPPSKDTKEIDSDTGGGGSTLIRVFQTKNSTSQFATNPGESTDTSQKVSTEATCTLPTDDVVKSPTRNAVYYISTDCTKRALGSSAKYFSYFTSWSTVRLVSEDSLDAVPNDTLGFMPWGPLYKLASGTLIKTPSDPKTYLLLEGTLYHIENEAAAAFQFGPSWATWIEDVDAGLLENYPLSETQLDTTTRPDGILIKYTTGPKVYQLDTEDGTQVKRWIPDEATFQALNFRDDRIVTIPSIETYPDGTNLSL